MDVLDQIDMKIYILLLLVIELLDFPVPVYKVLPLSPQSFCLTFD